jgi:transposase
MSAEVVYEARWWVDFGEKRVVIGDEMVRVYLFVATLGHSRRLHVRAFRHERQACWFEGLESAFRAFGGVAEEVLLDNTGRSWCTTTADPRGPL